MKTVGQIIRSARLQRNLSIDQLSALTKIDAKYIDALESDRYDLLPSETFAKGFIRNLSLRLDRDPNELISIFRRDFRNPDKPRHTSIHQKTNTLFSFASSQALPFVLGGLIFIIYLIFQFRAILTPPELQVTAPAAGAVLVSPIEIEGQTSVDANIFINSDTSTKPDPTGHFLVRLSLPVGETILEIKTTNRFGRSSFKKIPLTIVSK